MDSKEFIFIRLKLKKTQKQMAGLLGRSLRSVQSFEQGWRKIPENVERQILHLIFMKNNDGKALKPCWEVTNCPMEKRKRCPAWEFKAGHLCWLINGTICQGKVHRGWDKKMESCRNCPVFQPIELLLNILAPHPETYNLPKSPLKQS